MNCEINNVLMKQCIRSCQKHAVEVFQKFYRSKNKNTGDNLLLNLPTGAGKTGVITLISHYTKAKSILVICHRKAIQQQLGSEIESSFFKKIGLHKPKFMKKTYRTNRALNCLQKDTSNTGIYITTFQKLLWDVKSAKGLFDIYVKMFDLIIIDEGHYEPSPNWQEMINKFHIPKIIITATPYRNDLYQFNVSTKHYYIYTFNNAIKDNVICMPTFECIKLTGLISKLHFFLEKNIRSRVIVKCNSIDDIDKYHKILQDAGYSVASIHDTFKDKTIYNEQNKFEHYSKQNHHRYQILIHQYKLNEGIDIPEAKLLILTDTVKNGRELVQDVGRVVRKFNGIEPVVFDLSDGNNIAMWGRYNAFDAYISHKVNQKNFIHSLNQGHVFEEILKALPEHRYFDHNFKKKININNISINDLQIPTASVCFIHQEESYDQNIFIDHLNWDLSNQGHLVRQLKCEQYENLSVLVVFSLPSSRFLKNHIFYEPKLDIIVVREFNFMVAIFDSLNRSYLSSDDQRKKYRLKKYVNDGLNNLVSKDHHVKEAGSSVLGDSKHRPAKTIIGGLNLNNIQARQHNVSQRLNNYTFDNLDEKTQKIISRYYVGIKNGRISDQKNHNLTISEFYQWLDTINQSLSNTNQISHQSIIHSYATELNEEPKDLIVTACIIDLSDFSPASNSSQEEPEKKDFHYVPITENDKEYIPILDETSNKSIDILTYSISLLNGTIQLYYALNNNEFITKDDRNESDCELTGYLNNEKHFQILYENGVVYSSDKFYKIKFPYEKGLTIENSWINEIIHPLAELQNTELNEKGEYRTSEVISEHLNIFASPSIFSLVDQLCYSSGQDSSKDMAGVFYDYIPKCDLVLCTDMGTEPADFIISSSEKLCFVHIKCGDTISPQSSAGALSEVGSQAIKNIHILLSDNALSEVGNIKSWSSTWKLSQVAVKDRYQPSTVSMSRYRLFNGQRDIQASANNEYHHYSKQIQNELKKRLKSPNLQKEIWLIVGNSFSKGHFEKEMFKEDSQDMMKESIQAYQLLEGWLATCENYDIALKVFCSP